LVLTLARAFSEIFTFSSCAARASSLCVNSSSYARSYSYSSLATAAADTAAREEEGEGKEEACIKPTYAINGTSGNRVQPPS
jgi:hypothetical protein